MSALALLNATGEKVRDRWSEFQFDEKHFGAIAADVLKETALHKTLEWGEILKEFIRGGRIDSLQVGSRFSDLQLIPYRHGRFYIEVLFWLSGSTTIHEHSFDGAFIVLEGESLAAEYAFEESRRINSKFLLGDIFLRKSEHLCKGDVRIIRPAGEFIHNVFHLATPSVTIVLRTEDNPEVMPQYEYIYPGVALETRNLCMDMIKRIQAWTILLESLPQDEIESQWLAHIRNCSLDELYWLLRSVGIKWMSEELKQRAKLAINERDGGAVIQAALKNERRSARIVNMRRFIFDQGQRYLLATVLMANQRAEILSLLEHARSGPDHWAEAFLEIEKKRGSDWPKGLFTSDHLCLLFDRDADAKQVVAQLSEDQVKVLANDFAFSPLLKDGRGERQT